MQCRKFREFDRLTGPGAGFEIFLDIGARFDFSSFHLFLSLFFFSLNLKHIVNMLTQYIHNFINNFDQKKTMDQLQSVASSKEGVIGLATAALLMSTVAVYKSTRVKL
jgi:hypothetical protein